MIFVRCSSCQKTHLVMQGDTPCAPGAWVEETSGVPWEEAERLRAAGRAITDIAAERQRQIDEEGYDYAHDDEHQHGELAQAAAAFALPYADVDGDRMPRLTVWPWGYPPTLLRQPDPARRREELVRAGALIVAEIERLDRQPAPVKP